MFKDYKVREKHKCSLRWMLQLSGVARGNTAWELKKKMSSEKNQIQKYQILFCGIFAHLKYKYIL